MDDQLLLESWDRQCSIISNLASLVTEANRGSLPSEDSWPIDEHLCHIHEVRYGWLGRVSKKHQEVLGDVLIEESGNWVPIEDLDEIRRQLAISATAVRDAVSEALIADTIPFGPYEHPFFFIQHMVWHEGYHAGLVFLGLGHAGAEPDDAWSETNVWSLWRHA